MASRTMSGSPAVTACPGATVQGLHVDTQGDWGQKLAVNFSVEDITPENGASEH